MGSYLSHHPNPAYNQVGNNNNNEKRQSHQSNGCQPNPKLRKLTSIEVDPDDADEIYYPTSPNAEPISKRHRDSKVVRKSGLEYLVTTEQLCGTVKQYEIEMKNLRTGTTCVSNCEYDNDGSFGRIVRNGKVQNLYLTSESSSVLVKQVDPEARSDADKEYAWKSFLREINLLVWIGWHPNVVTFLGIAVGDVHQKELYMICEYCKHGNLRDYLRRLARKSGRIQEVSHDVQILAENPIYQQFGDFNGSDHVHSIKYDEELEAFITKWILEVSNAMDFLVSRRVVYVELTASSVQLTENLTAKLGNFTVARSLKSDEDHFILNEHIPLPWRWLAPESFYQRKYSFETDMWGFGVLLWETLSLGQQPYSGMNWTTGFAQHLKDGLRLPRLPNMTFPVYNFLESCWELEPGRRPAFPEALERLSRALEP